ncbi:MAG: hypothetical protein HY069_03030 [Chlamydiia bacterium]|nr:hypothetical protein [Chlamydiia bacterium]
MLCPCCSKKNYIDCCKPYHDGQEAPSALALMRSRYSAYALDLSAYILRTTHPKSPYFEKDRKKWQESVHLFSQTTRFLSLEIHGWGDDWVSFTAHLEQQGKKVLLKEKSHFEKLHDKWFYHSALSLDTL